MGLLASDTFKPVLFVGLGGNGGKIVNQLAGRLKRHPNWERIRDLAHFLVIDTNKDDLDKLRDTPPDCRFLVSAFNSASYVARKRGLAQNPADPLVTQWVPADYQFRTTQGAGAGQIRMESRLRLYYNLEDDRAGIRRKVRQVLETATGRDNPWRDNDDRVVRVVIYGSVAGGTGSGGFLPVGYLLRQMVSDQGWGRPSVTAVLSLPTTFLNRVKPELHDDIKANGYAALKELEYLTRTLAYQGGADSIEFHYDPGTNDPARTRIHDRPFDLTYLIDQPSRMSIERFEHAVADASFLQLMSPLLGAQAGEYDNYEKRQKQLAAGYFSVHYGAFGTALLQLPRNDLVRYAGLRYVARAFREFLCFGGDDPQFRVPWGDPAFERLAPDEKNRRIDEKFVAYVAWRADAERQNDEKGVFTAISEQTGRGGKSLEAGFQELLAEKFGKLDELIEVPDFKIQEISEGNPSVSRQLNELRRSYADARAKVLSEYLPAMRTELRTGALLSAFFTRYDVNPIAQRLFLIRLMAKVPLTPYADPEEGEYLVIEGARGLDLDATEVQDRASRLNGELAAAAEPGFFSKITDRDNKAFNAAKRRAIGWLNELGQDMVESLQRDFWRGFAGELRLVAEQLLTAFRMVAEIADTRAREAEAATESFRKDPGADPTSDVAQYYLDSEALRDDRRKDRLWGIFFRHNLDKSAFFRTEDIFPLVTSAFLPRRDPSGLVRARDASEIVEEVRQGLVERAQEIYRKAMGPEGMALDLQKALELEQRYIAILDQKLDPEELYQAGKLVEAIDAVSDATVKRGVEDKLKRLADECVLLAHIDQAERDDPTVTPADVFYAGLAARYDSDEDGSLGRTLRGVVSGLNFVAGWEEPDALVLYRATLGIPVYFFKNVAGELHPSYKKLRDDPKRAYPLHIEALWEAKPGLPDLDPVEMKHADERAKAEAAAEAARDRRESRILGFSLCVLSGHVVPGEEGWKWSYEGASAKLGVDRAQAFSAFEAMDPDLRAELLAAGRQAMQRKVGDRRGREQAAEELEAAGKRLKAHMFAAAQEYRDAEKALLKEEIDVLAALGEAVADLSQPVKLPEPRRS